MKKRILGVFLILSVICMNALPLMAATHAIKVVQENYSVKQLSNDGASILNTINTETSDLNNGKVNIDITIDNTKSTEVIYAIDNGLSAKDIKISLVDTIKENAKNLEGLENVKQGIVTTTDSNTSYIPLDSENILTALDTVKDMESATIDGEIFGSLAKAKESFGEQVINKVIVAFISNMGAKTADEYDNLKQIVSMYQKEGINLIVYGIDLTEVDAFKNVFTDVTKYELTANTLNQIGFVNNVLALLPAAKPAIGTVVTFDKYIIDNFNITNVTATKGNAEYTDENKVIWGIDEIKPNEQVKLTYTLELKDQIEEYLVNEMNLKTNRQIVVTQSGNYMGKYPADNVVDDEICSPVITVLPAGVTNPNTGIATYIIAGSCILAVALVTLVVLNNKNEFSRI